MPWFTIRQATALVGLTLLGVMLAPGCNTAARFDVEGEQIAEVAVVGLMADCASDDFDLRLVLVDQRGGPIRVGGLRLPDLPRDAAAAVRFEDVRVDDAPATIAVIALTPRQQPEGDAATVILDRAGAICGALPPGPWGRSCNPRPCGAASETCTIARGCCPADHLCLADWDPARGLIEACAVPDDSCPGGCPAGARCADGACKSVLRGATDPADRLATLFGQSLVGALPDDDADLDRRGGVRALVANGAGLLPLIATPARQRAAVEDALIRLYSPFGESQLLRDLSLRDAAPATLVWALAAGLGDRPASAAETHFAVVDTATFGPEDDAAFAEAACASGGIYGRWPADLALGDAASRWLPAAARAHLQLRVTIDPPPARGARLRARVVLDTGRLTAAGPPPANPRLTQPVDLIIGGQP